MSNKPQSDKLHFDSNLPGLLNEVMNNQSCSILKLPIGITKGILGELAELAIELDDDRLHRMMLRLGLYDCTASERVERIKELERRIEYRKEVADLAVHFKYDRKRGICMTQQGGKRHYSLEMFHPHYLKCIVDCLNACYNQHAQKRFLEWAEKAGL